MINSYLREAEYSSDIETQDFDIDHQRNINESYHQQIFSDDEELFVDDRMCNVEQGESYVSLSRPLDEEIAKIAAAMIAQVKSNYQLRKKTSW